MKAKFGIFAGSLLVLALLLGCSLPRGAALQSEILAAGGSPGSTDFALHQVNSRFLEQIKRWPKPDKSRAHGWLARRQGPSASVIDVGDRLTLSIWDSGENSLLTSPDQKTVEIDAIEVAPDGSIFVPYLERIPVKGLSLEEARASIQSQITAIIASAQVQLLVAPGRVNSVDLVSGTEQSGSFPMPDRQFSVLNLIALGGGISKSLRNPQIRLIRNNRPYVISAARLYRNPGLDTILQGGDKVVIEEDLRSFTALGASGTEAQIAFPADQVSAIEAMALAGGVSDTRGNPQAILILRNYPDDMLGETASGPTKRRNIFVVDLTTADGVFSAGQFQIAPGDVVMATESAVTSAHTLLGLLGRTLGISNAL